MLAGLIGCKRGTLLESIDREGDDRLVPYLIETNRVVGAKEVYVFNEARAKEDLEALKEAFGQMLLPPQAGEISAPELADLIGCSHSAVNRSRLNESDHRLNPYLLGEARLIREKRINVFDAAKVRRDLAGLKEAFGLGGERLPPQPGELTSSMLADLIGCSDSYVKKIVREEGDNRLAAYLLEHVRFLHNQEVSVFDGAKVRRDLDRLKEIFGQGGERLPLQSGELTSSMLAGLIGCHDSSIRKLVKKGGDDRLTPYLLNHTRIMQGREIMVFDEAAVRRDLDKLKRAFGKA